MLVERGSKDLKIDLKKVRDTATPYNHEEAKMFNAKVFQRILSRRSRPEQYNGIVNLFYVIKYPNATAEEIESSLVMCACETHLTRDV